ncbi:MAG: NAD(+)/NADH kinase [Alistipes indistinctus]
MIGINSGRLGFLANITMEGLDAALCDIRDGNYAVEERTLLSAEGDFIDRTCYPYAFNEVTIQRHDTSMIAAEVFVDGEMIATCHGDGMLVSTPSGSTAYSLSVGGPVVAPDCRCFIVSPIAPAQPDDASGGCSRYFAGYFPGAYARRKVLRLARQPQLSGRRRNGAESQESRKIDFWCISKIYRFMIR